MLFPKSFGQQMVYPNPLDLPSKPPLPHLTLSLDMCWQGPIVKKKWDSMIPSQMLFMYLFLKPHKGQNYSIETKDWGRLDLTWILHLTYIITPIIKYFERMKNRTIQCQGTVTEHDSIKRSLFIRWVALSEFPAINMFWFTLHWWFFSAGHEISSKGCCARTN